MTSYTEGFSHFVASMTAPVASGWSDLAGWGLHPLESAALSRRTQIAVIAQGAPNGPNRTQAAIRPLARHDHFRPVDARPEPFLCYFACARGPAMSETRKIAAILVAEIEVLVGLQPRAQPWPPHL